MWTVDYFHVPWMDGQLLGITAFHPTPYKTGVLSNVCSLKSLLMKVPQRCYSKELGSIKMEGKEKAKDFNERFTHILSKFAATSALPSTTT